MEATSIPSREGRAVFKDPSLPADKECQTWYKVIGDLSSGRRPLIALHGGPGASHIAFADTFQLYAAKTGTPVVLYDQLGNGNSTHLREKRGDEAFWVPDLFVAELDNLIRHLGIRERFDLYGHSWGAKLAAKYAISPSSVGSGLHKVIIASGSCNQKDLLRAGELLRSELPQDVQDTINKYRAEKNLEAPEYRAALGVFFKKHMCRLDPWPMSLLKMMKILQEDDTVYYTMLGEDALNPTGNLRDFDMTEDCKAIKQPCLLINGEFDATLDFCLKPWFDGIPKVKWVKIPDSSHMFHSEQPEKFMDIIWDFLS